MSIAQKSLLYSALQLLQEGWSPKEVSEHLGVPISTLYRWRAASQPRPPSKQDLADATPAVIGKLASLACKGHLHALRDFLDLLRRHPDPALSANAAWHAYRALETGIFQAELEATDPALVPEILAFHRRALRRLDLVLAGKEQHPRCDLKSPLPRLDWSTLARAAEPPPTPSTQTTPGASPQMRIPQETPQWA